jgi:hypothetical protein
MGHLKKKRKRFFGSELDLINKARTIKFPDWRSCPHSDMVGTSLPLITIVGLSEHLTPNTTC